MNSPMSEQIRMVDQIARPLRIRNVMLALYDAILLTRSESPAATRQLDRATERLIELVGPATACGVLEALMRITERAQLADLEQALIELPEIAAVI